MLKKLKQFFTNAKAQPPTKDKFILVVEDNPVDQRFIVKILQSEGYQVRSVADGKTALELALETQPDLILLDCDIPEIKGLEVCRILKEESETSSIPVVFLTGDDTPRTIFDCYEMDAENYLKKPVTAKLLLSELEIIFETQTSKN
jgi:CheY-like chemotaxis protein